ncbi:hypothetical protein BLOT_009140 [Blomia tropicalis]|nr:hypothetical protein BLOT_009140 [Blomia tropicalis]
MENRQRNIAALLSDSNCSKRRCQKSVNLGFFEQIAPNMTNQEFWSHFRISRWIFDYLIINLKDKLKRQDTIFKKAINIEKRILVALKVLALNMELMNVASLFGIGLTSVWRIFHDFIGAVNDILKPKHIVVPTIMVFV